MTLSTQLKEPFFKFIVKLFSRQVSNFYVVFGRRGSGKTDFILFMCEILRSKGVIKYFATNIKIYDSPFVIERIDNLEDLRLWSKENKGRKLYLFDEVGKTVSRRRPMASLNVELLNELQVIRKHKLSLLATCIDEEDTDRAILKPSVLDGYFEKYNFKNPKVAYFTDFLENRGRSLGSIPRTSIRFDTWDSAPFKEHSKKRISLFKDEDKKKLWRLVNGTSGSELDMHPMQIKRLKDKYIKYHLERELALITSN